MYEKVELAKINAYFKELEAENLKESDVIPRVGDNAQHERE